MYKIDKFGDFSHLDGDYKKHQIILTNTSRGVENYLQSLKYRYNGKFTKIPHYIVTREGTILKLLNGGSCSNFQINSQVNKNSITISLENLGWLQKEPLKDYYVNWIGDIYKGIVFEKKWRDYFFWQPYTSDQIKALSFLCSNLCSEFSIKTQFIGHNTKVSGVEKFEGIVCRSNFSSKFTDVTPAFDFELFLKTIENEQLT